MKASTESPIASGTTLPPIRTGHSAFGCTSSLSSRPACRASSNVRNILMPPPVEPVLQTMHVRKSIQIGAKTGHCSKSCETKPEVVAIEMTLNVEWRREVKKFGYV